MSVIETEMKALQDNLEQLKLDLITVTTKKRRKQKALEGLFLKWTTLKPKLIENCEASMKELDEKRNVKHRLVNSLKEDVAVQEKIDSLLKQITQFCEDFQKDYDLFQKYKSEYFDKLTSEAKLHMLENLDEVKKIYQVDKRI